MESTYSRAVQADLAGWSIWHHQQSGVVRGYPNAIPTERLRGSTVKSAPITDEVAEKVDSSVAKLCVRSPDQGEVLKLYYLEHKTLSEIGRRLGIGRMIATQRLKQAETAIEWIIY